MTQVDKLVLCSPSQVGIGAPPSPQDALNWYRLAADAGDKRAAQRLRSNSSAVGGGGLGAGGDPKRDRNAEKMMKDRRNDGNDSPADGDNKEGCVVM